MSLRDGDLADCESECGPQGIVSRLKISDVSNGDGAMFGRLVSNWRAVVLRNGWRSRVSAHQGQLEHWINHRSPFIDQGKLSRSA